MNYVLFKTHELAEIVPLRCAYKTDLDLQLAIQSVGLGSLGSTQTQFLNYGPELVSPQLEKVIAQFVDEIDFASLHLILSHPRLKNHIKTDVLLSQYQIPPTAHVLKTLERSVKWTDAVLHWLAQKKIKPHELSFLNLLAQDECTTLLSHASTSLLSKMDALKILETASELILMKIDLAGVLDSTWTEKTAEQIKHLRYPISFTYNPVNQVQLKWPKNVSTQTKRIQDKMGFQVQFFVSHPEELGQTLSQLEKMVPDWASKIEVMNS